MRAIVRLGTLLALVGGIGWGLAPHKGTTPALITQADAAPGSIPAFSPTPEQLGYFPGQVLVKYKDPAKIPSLRSAQALTQFGKVGLHEMDVRRNIPGLVIMHVTGDVKAAVAEFRKDPNVLFAEPSYVRYLCRTPDDPLFPQQQNMSMSRAPLGWDIRTSAGSVKIATIDTGVDFNHPDLVGQLVPGGGFNSRGDQSGSAQDDSGHGTAVAGVIGALGNNTAYVAGAVWDVDILPIRSCGTASLICTIPDEVEAITIAIQQGVKVINLSLGGYSSSETERTGIKAAVDADIVICAAAGNGINGEGQLGKFDGGTLEQNIFYPAGYDDVIGVGSVDAVPDAENISQMRRSRYSNYGDMVDVVGVGSNVITLAPSVQVTSPIFRCDPGACYYEQKVGQISGTSFATPLVSGLAGLLRAQFPDLGQAAIAGIIRGTARDLGTQDANGRNDEFGFGLVDFFTALSGQGGAVNDTFAVGVAANPIFTNQVYVTIKLRQPLLPGTQPTINVTIKQAGHADVPLTVQPLTLATDPNIIFNRFRVDGKADITVDVTGTLPDNSTRELQINYKKEA